VIEARVDLVRAEPREGRNPFTGGKTIFRPPDTSAALVVEGREVARLGWAQDDSDAIIIWCSEADAATTIPIVAQIASKLDAVFVPDLTLFE